MNIVCLFMDCTYICKRKQTEEVLYFRKNSLVKSSLVFVFD